MHLFAKRARGNFRRDVSETHVSDLPDPLAGDFDGFLQRTSRKARGTSEAASGELRLPASAEDGCQQQAAQAGGEGQAKEPPKD